MEFDILNELVTSTVFDLFTNTQKIAIQCKPKVRELEGLIKQQNHSKRNLNQNDSFSVISDGGSSRQNSANKTQSVIKYKSVTEWMEKEAPKRLKEAFKRLGLDESLTRSVKRVELQQYIDAMSVDSLANQKKKVKNELKSYDNDFGLSFHRQPNHEEKEPLRPLYVYYKKLKQALTKRGGQEMSQQRIQAAIVRIKSERRDLREQIENYQKEFQRNNNRRIRYVRDIAPIDTQYRRYKQLKNDLLKYEQMLNR